MFSVEATNSQINFPVSFFLVNINESILVYWGSRKCCQQNKMEEDSGTKGYNKKYNPEPNLVLHQAIDCLQKSKGNFVCPLAMHALFKFVLQLTI